MWFLARRLADRPQDLCGVVSQPELEEAIAELLAVRAAAHADALLLEDLRHRDTDRASLRRRQVLPQPLQHGLLAPGTHVTAYQAVGSGESRLVACL